MDRIEKAAEVKAEIRHIEGRIECHKKIIQRLQALGMKMTGELFSLENPDRKNEEDTKNA